MIDLWRRRIAFELGGLNQLIIRACCTVVVPPVLKLNLVGDVDLIAHRYLPTMAEIAGLALAVPAIIDILIKGGARMYARIEEARRLDETMGR
jgi:hypothetical protein